MKRSFAGAGFHDEQAASRPRYDMDLNPGGGGLAIQSDQAIALKVLLNPQEVTIALGPNGGFDQEIMQQTGAKVQFSGAQELYPGTQLQEMTVMGAPDAVAFAVNMVLDHIAQEQGCICSGETNIPSGQSTVRVVIPIAAAKAVIGRGGENIKLLRMNTGLKVHVDEMVIGSGELAEQTVILQGPYAGMQAAVTNMAERVMEFIEAPWFVQWATISNAGNPNVAISQVGAKNGVAGGKGPKGGKGGFAAAGGWSAPIGAPMKGGGGDGGWGAGGKGGGDWSGQMKGGCGGGGDWNAQGCSGMKGCGKSPGGWGGMGPAQQQSAAGKGYSPAANNSWNQGSASGYGADVLVQAAQSLPPGIAAQSNTSQNLSFTCPAGCVSMVIGKQGLGTKEITAATGAKIMIREIQGNEAEKSVTIYGHAVGVAAAYLYVLGRINTALENMPAFAQQGAAPQEAGQYQWEAAGATDQFGFEDVNQMLAC